MDTQPYAAHTIKRNRRQCTEIFAARRRVREPHEIDVPNIDFDTGMCRAWPQNDRRPHAMTLKVH